MQVIKSNGEFQNFNSKKIYSSIREAGGSKKLAQGAAQYIKSKYHDGIDTKELKCIFFDKAYHLIIFFLRKKFHYKKSYILIS